MIEHHLPDTMLLDRAAGSLPVALDVLVASHLTLCPRCRSELTILEEAAGALLLGITPTAGDDEAGLAALLGRLDGPLPAPHAPPPPHRSAPADSLLPAPLLQFVGPHADLRWRTLLPGVARRVTLGLELAGVAATLEEVRPGFRVPQHGHAGVEITMVLVGGYADAGRRYARGDVQVVGPETVHGLEIDDDGQPCLLLSIRSGARVPQSTAARFARWIGAL